MNMLLAKLPDLKIVCKVIGIENLNAKLFAKFTLQNKATKTKCLFMGTWFVRFPNCHHVKQPAIETNVNWQNVTKVPAVGSIFMMCSRKTTLVMHARKVHRIAVEALREKPSPGMLVMEWRR